MMICGDEPDIIFIVEVIPKAQVHPIPLALLNLPGYKMYLNFDASSPNLGTSGRRGVATYASDRLKTTVTAISDNAFRLSSSGFK